MNEDMMGGLAQQSASRMPTVKEVMLMLQQGMDPEELVEKGIPKELVQAAIQMLMQSQGVQSPMQEGLANTVVKPIESQKVV